jgi:LDH2 family malate/lactate/ureidoglycolate dehydrogenase
VQLRDRFGGVDRKFREMRFHQAVSISPNLILALIAEHARTCSARTEPITRRATRRNAMQISIADAYTLAERVMTSLGYREDEARIASAHLMDSELRGLDYAGFARMISIAERLGKQGRSTQPISVIKETPVSARLDGADNLGYLVAHRATEIAIEKANANGIAVVGASDTWYTGMLSYYAEMAGKHDLVTMIASNASPWVAPHGGTEGRFGTNPICFSFPSKHDPVIWDIGTSAIIHAQVVLARRLGRQLTPGLAFGPDGEPTTDPDAALRGAFAPWGGHRGSGLAMVVQMLGMLAGSPMIPGELRDFGYFIVAIRPDILTDTESFKSEISGYADTIRSTRPVEGGDPVRMPFDRSRADRARAVKSGVLEIPDTIYAGIQAIVNRA